MRGERCGYKTVFPDRVRDPLQPIGPQGSQITILPAYSHEEDLPIAGKTIGPNIYYPPKNKTIRQAWDRGEESFEDSKGRYWKWDKLYQGHWDVTLKDKSHINVKPDGFERGEGKNNKNNKR